MERRAFLVACLIAALSGCAPEAMPYRQPWDRFVVHFGLQGITGYFACSRNYEVDGMDVTEFIGDERCFRFDPPERIRGVWLVGMESSEFLPDAVEAPRVNNVLDERDDVAWLTANFEPREQLPWPEGTFSMAYFIEFVGRRASYPGLYGYAGKRRLFVIDELLSARPIRPPRSLSRAEFDAQIRALRTAHKPRDERPPHCRSGFPLPFDPRC